MRRQRGRLRLRTKNRLRSNCRQQVTHTDIVINFQRNGVVFRNNFHIICHVHLYKWQHSSSGEQNWKVFSTVLSVVIPLLIGETRHLRLMWWQQPLHRKAIRAICIAFNWNSDTWKLWNDCHRYINTKLGQAPKELHWYVFDLIQNRMDPDSE